MALNAARLPRRLWRQKPWLHGSSAFVAKDLHWVYSRRAARRNQGRQYADKGHENAGKRECGRFKRGPLEKETLQCSGQREGSRQSGGESHEEHREGAGQVCDTTA